MDPTLAKRPGEFIRSRSITTSTTVPRPFTPQEIASFLQDEQTAINMLNATFTNNITLTFNVGFGSFEGQNLDTIPAVNASSQDHVRFPPKDGVIGLPACR